MDIVGRNIRSLTEAYSKLEREANKVGIQVNEDKTKLLMVRASENTRNLIGSHQEVGNKKFEVVSEFTYLGSLVDEKASSQLEIKKRIVTAQRAFYSIIHVLSSKSVSRNAKFVMYKFAQWQSMAAKPGVGQTKMNEL